MSDTSGYVTKSIRYFSLLLTLALCGPVSAQLLDQTASYERQVRQLTADYFSAKDSGDYERAYAFLAPSDQREIPFDIWRRMTADFNKTAGHNRGRAIKKITWYRDPPNAAGLYCAVDFLAEFEQIGPLYGYLVFHQEADGKFLIMREEQNYIGKKLKTRTPQGDT